MGAPALMREKFEVGCFHKKKEERRGKLGAEPVGCDVPYADLNYGL